jgi:D-proline reductase (dithiol) PrdB
MGANAGEPHNIPMQLGIIKGALRALKEIETPGKILALPFEYIAHI